MNGDKQQNRKAIFHLSYDLDALLERVKERNDFAGCNQNIYIKEGQRFCNHRLQMMQASVTT